MIIENTEIKLYKSNLKKYRVSNRLTQTELSDISGVSIKSIALYEQHPDKLNKASVESVNKLAECLGVSIEELIKK